MKKLLDVGCGPGTISNIGLYNELKDAYHIYGIDPIRRNISLIQKRFPGGVFTTGKAEKLPFADNEFDAIVSRHVLEHVDDPDATIREMRRVSKRNATVTLAVPHPVFERITNAITPHYMGKGHHHQRVFTRGSLVSLLTRNGYVIQQARNDKWPYFVIDLLLAVTARISRNIQMEEQSGVFLVGKGNYIRKSKHYPKYLVVYAVLEALNSVLFFLNYIIPFEIRVVARKK